MPETREFFVVWNEHRGPPTCKHETQAVAEAEAERLARANPGQRFHVLRLCGSCQFGLLVWERTRAEVERAAAETPF